MLKPLSNPGLNAHDTVGHIVARTLQRHGITQFFGQSLPSMFVLAAEEMGMRQIAYRTENAGGYMADAYARMSNTPAVITAQNGPAATLLVAPLAEALKVSIPVIALVQDVARDQTDKNAFQDLDHIGLFKPVTKWVRRVDQASRVEDYVEQAIIAACSGRPGPVALMLPADLLTEAGVSSSVPRTSNLGRFPLDRSTPDHALLRQAVDALIQAKNPVIIAGGGVHGSGAHDALVEFANTVSIPVGTTNMGKGAVDESAPLSLGVMANCMGPNGSGRYLKDFITGADVILLIGNRTNQNGTDSWALYPKNARFIHLDIDGQEIGRNYDALRLVGDAKLALQAMTEIAKGADLRQRSAGKQALVARIAQGKTQHLAESHDVRTSNAMPIRPERIMQELNALLTGEDTVVADASYSTLWVTNYLTARKPGQRFITPRGLAGLGWGMPMAMGARLAKQDGQVFCLVGDGGFGHVWSEMETCKRMGIKVITLLINNGILGYQKHAENVKFGEHTSAVDFSGVDHAAIARACGIHGVRVSDPARIADALRTAMASEDSTLIEVMCTENAFPPITFYTPESNA
ncbi:acetolactate synthase catalytic subunit [Acidovorax sp. Be4]|uniref:Acetolactate synthase catalytic subunit n=1 Tax=Acidovorax bellezanensis TaxID=2976702 RepID=A0ABT2PPM8_9BURK|nr:acetolactate synthase catalytic subunit [Acidovorax sp. Be4]MCT9811789.1 acetolactate synthase catalytic subunit [Acidovorax sp. Be4]